MIQNVEILTLKGNVSYIATLAHTHETDTS